MPLLSPYRRHRPANRRFLPADPDVAPQEGVDTSRFRPGIDPAKPGVVQVAVLLETGKVNCPSCHQSAILIGCLKAELFFPVALDEVAKVSPH